MTAILIGDCKVEKTHGGFTSCVILTANTADTGDTVDISSILPADYNIVDFTVWNVSYGTVGVGSSFSTATGTVTLGDFSSRTNCMWAINVKYVDYTIDTLP